MASSNLLLLFTLLSLEEGEFSRKPDEIHLEEFLDSSTLLKVSCEKAE